MLNTPKIDFESKIKERLEIFEGFRDDVFETIINAKNIDSGRVLKWAKELQSLEEKIGELKALLIP